MTHNENFDDSLTAALADREVYQRLGAGIVNEAGSAVNLDEAGIFYDRAQLLLQDLSNQGVTRGNIIDKIHYFMNHIREDSNPNSDLDNQSLRQFWTDLTIEASKINQTQQTQSQENIQPRGLGQRILGWLSGPRKQNIHP